MSGRCNTCRHAARKDMTDREKICTLMRCSSCLVMRHERLCFGIDTYPNYQLKEVRHAST